MSPMAHAAPAHSPRQARMIALLKDLAPAEGYTQSLLDGVSCMRSDHPLSCTQALYEPSIVIVVQGRKRGFHGGAMYVYDAQHYLVLSVPLPFSIETEASPAEPLLGLALRMLEALSSPVEARLLGPSIYREITYRVLTGDQGGGLRAALQQGGSFGRIAKVLRRIHTQYDRGLDVATLASE